jgi:uncharacterized membrane protein YhiD involved in acid resistance
MGMASGAGLPVLAVGGMLLALFVLEVLDRIEQAVLHERARARARPRGTPEA